MAKVTLVPRSVNLTGKWDKVGHGEVTINNARIIEVDMVDNALIKVIHLCCMTGIYFSMGNDEQ